MIIVEVEIPIMGKRYDFQIDENVPLYEVKEEIIEMICRKEQCLFEGDVERMLIWTRDGRRLSQENSAKENGLRTGSQIMVV